MQCVTKNDKPKTVVASRTQRPQSRVGGELSIHVCVLLESIFLVLHQSLLQYLRKVLAARREWDVIGEHGDRTVAPEKCAVCIPGAISDNKQVT